MEDVYERMSGEYKNHEENLIKYKEYMEILNDIKTNNEKFKKLGDKKGFEICILNNINYFLKK